jgi:hypothetical protein
MQLKVLEEIAAGREAVLLTSEKSTMSSHSKTPRECNTHPGSVGNKEARAVYAS